MSTADNQIFSGSQVIASDENNGVHFPINKLAYSDDQGNIIDVTSSNPLPTGSGSESTDNTTIIPLTGGATFTGVGEQNFYPQVGVFCFSDTEGTMYFDWSVNGTDWHQFPVAGFSCSANIPAFHTAVKLGRHFRVRFVNGSSAQSTFRLTTYFGADFVPSNSPYNQPIELDSDSLAVRGNNFYDEIARGLRGGVIKWNKFGYNPDIDIADGEVPIWDSVVNTFTPLASPETFDISYDGTSGGTTDGAGTTGAIQLTFYYIDANGSEAISIHNLGTDGTDTTSFSGYGINRVTVSISGSANKNVSVISVTATTSTTVQATIPAGGSVTQQMIFFVAHDRTANAKFLWINVVKVSVGGQEPVIRVKGYVYNRIIDTTFEVFRGNLDAAHSSEMTISDPVGFTLGSQDVLYFVADTDKDNTEVTGRISIISYAI